MIYKVFTTRFEEQKMRGFDFEMREIVAQNVKGRGIHQHPGTSPTKVRLLFLGGVVNQ